jgi:hypothetical protein
VTGSPHRRRGLLAAAAAALPAAARASTTATGPVDLLLVLAVDASSSIDDHEARLQRDGYRAAMADRRVLAAARSGPHGAIGVAYVEWSDAEHQRLAVPWTRIASEADARAWAAALLGLPVLRHPAISISRALAFSRRVLGEAPWPGAARRVIDVSGDGVNNDGPPVERERDRAVAAGITVNGLAIEDPHRRRGAWAAARAPVTEHYRGAVVGGAGAFVVRADGFADFGRALRHKLVREIASAGGGTGLVG